MICVINIKKKNERNRKESKKENALVVLSFCNTFQLMLKTHYRCVSLDVVTRDYYDKYNHCQIF